MNDLNINETITLLQELIRNECVNPPGNEMVNIKSIEKLFEVELNEILFFIDISTFLLRNHTIHDIVD